MDWHSNTWLFLRSTHLRKKTVYYNKIYLYRPQKNWNIIIWILLLQIYLKGPNVSKGYVHDPKKTAQTIDEDDWLHIGDIGLFIGGLFLLKLFKQHWQQNAWYLGLSLIHVKLDGCFFFFAFYQTVFFRCRIISQNWKITYSKCRISTYASKKLNSCIPCMTMFIVFLFDISTSCAVFLLFFWLTLTSMIHAINVPFLSNLTFPSVSSLLLSLFTFVCCKCITHCFVFYLFGSMFVSCT